MTDDETLIEQLRHACSVAFGDLIAHGMPKGVSTWQLLLNAIRAAEDRLEGCVKDSRSEES